MLEISFGKNRSDTNWKPDYPEWADLVDRFKRVRRTNETMAEYDVMAKENRDRIKNGPAFVGGFIKGGRRKKENVENRWLITLDADNADNNFIFTSSLMLDGTAYAIYSTHSSRPDKRKYRLVIPVDRAMLPDEYAAVARKMADRIGMAYFDKTTFDVHRLMYFPSCSKDAKPELSIGEGEPLIVDDVLNEYADWRDPSEWPKHPDSEKSINAELKKLGDPEEKPGVIGVFCKLYSIQDGIEAFIPDVYLPTTSDDRWTYAGGSTFGGMRIYDDKWMYSEHQSDPANDGHCHNVFDLIRIHKFGHLDEDVKEHTPSSKYPSYKAMMEFAANIPEVKRERLADVQDDFEAIGTDPDDPDAWKIHLEVEAKSGIPYPTSKNAELILRSGAFKDVIAYDAFGNTEVVKQDLPWRKRERPNQEYEPWLGSDDKRMLHYFGKHYGFKSAATVQNAFTEVVHSNTFHPIKDYLESAIWDGTPRIDYIFRDYLGTPDGVYEREVSRKILVAACKRLYEPGCKFDEVVVLVGPQGSHKSSFIARLGGEWFSDSIRNFDNKEAGEHLQRAWIIELPELSALKKTESEETKAFLSRTTDRYRVAYDRVVSDFPRKCVFFGTTNTFDFLKDNTGGRRFWPIEVIPQNRKYIHFDHLTDALLAQIWAEALHYYKNGESVRLSPEADAIAKERQENHTEIDPRLGKIMEYLETPISDNWAQMDKYERRNYYASPNGNIRRDRVSAIEIWVECIEENGSIPNWEARAIIGLLSRIPGWEPYKANKGQAKVPGYGLQKVYVRTQDR
ncbi:virulence-associated E family protein [Acetivibrio cellulolyticus]|uniref:virulence-associated E family protein n=1 Tax=Acetivibrio cellulolyticus TaxID=35830 RepID=UPI0001E2D96E|nr:virulence-associated E family protein [Acetivibrio cellulolyticus]